MKTITIVFRGLMVLHKHLDTMEIGFVDALYEPPDKHAQTGAVTNNVDQPVDHPANHSAGHVPRILTTKDGVLSAIFDLRNRPELGKVRNWTLKVEDPVGPAASLFQSGSFDRTIAGSGPSFERDFRWIIDLEGKRLHEGDLSLALNTRQFLLVLYVRNGEFYTRLRSPQLKRRQLRPEGVSTTIDGGLEDPQEPSVYGPTAAVVGCDIQVGDAGSVKLMAGGSNGAIAFTFVPDEGTIYEISNSPPDVPVEEPNSIDAPGHFHMYYDKLFSNPMAQFDLFMDDQAPAPDPTLCGCVYLGLRQDPL